MIKNLFFRPAASQSTNESFGTAGEHNDTNEDTYANSSQDSTLVMREVSLRFNLWPLTAQKPTLVISAPDLLLFYRVEGRDRGLFTQFALSFTKQTDLNSLYRICFGAFIVKGQFACRRDR